MTTPAAALHRIDLPGPEDQARADLYALLARLLLAPPDAALLQTLAEAGATCTNHNPLETALAALGRTAATLTCDAARDEYNALFTGIGVPVLNPYGSLYLSGFLNEKPLVRLRDDLARLGLARRGTSGDTEDHLGALCESMRLLIEGGGRPPQAVEVQHAFFDTHIAPWYARCLDDMRNAPGAHFYKYAADLAYAFLTVEMEAFEVAEEEA